MYTYAQRELLLKFAGEISIVVTDIEHIFNEMLCDYFFETTQKRKSFTLHILNGDKLSFNNKAECLRSIGLEIEHDENNIALEQAIDLACKFKYIQDDVHHSIKCLDNNTVKLKINNIYNIGFHVFKKISNEYINDVVSNGISVKHKLKEVREILKETISPMQ